MPCNSDIGDALRTLLASLFCSLLILLDVLGLGPICLVIWCRLRFWYLLIAEALDSGSHECRVTEILSGSLGEENRPWAESRAANTLVAVHVYLRLGWRCSLMDPAV